MMFEEVITLSAYGNSIVSQQYNCIDYDAKDGVNLYRLKIVDQDGSYTYSEIISVTLNGDGVNLQAYPNPADNLLTISGFVPSTREMEVNVEDQLGRSLFKGVLPVQAGQMKTSIMDLNIVEAGVYYLQIGSGVNKRTIRLIRVH